MTGKLIVIEGIDGAGKSTQIGLLIDFLRNKRIKTDLLHFPSGSGVFGDLVSRFLRGEFGDVENVHPQLVALIFAEDRKHFANKIRTFQVQSDVVVVDRYVLSNMAFQCAKLTSEEEKRELRKWIYSFEYEYNKIPKPDVTLYLDVPFSFLNSSLSPHRQGTERNYLQGRHDIHEKNLLLQQSVKSEYEKLIEQDKDVTRIICFDSKGEMLNVNKIHERITENISKQLLQ